MVLCGPYRKDHDKLRRDYAAFLSLGCKVLSPRDLDFVDEIDGFVLGADERHRDPTEIEGDHLRAMEEADLVWLHAPDGYVGRSAAMELGFAHALGLRVFTRELPTDIALAGLVQHARSPHAAIGAVEAASGEAPSRSIVALQRYYSRMAEIRGWADESAEQTLDFLREELAELARALAEDRSEPIRRSPAGEAALELADVQLYVVHMANVLGLDLGAAVAAKERINEQRFRERPAA